MDGTRMQDDSPMPATDNDEALSNIQEGTTQEEEEENSSRNLLNSMATGQENEISGHDAGAGAESAANSTPRHSSLPNNNSNDAWDVAGDNSNDGWEGSPSNKPRNEPQPMGSPDVRKIANLEQLENKFEDGYDSDGNPPPPGTSDDIEFEEDEHRPAAPGEKQDECPLIDKTPRHIPIADADLEKLTLPKIKHELNIRGVQFKASGSQGKRAYLLERLRAALVAEIKVTIFMTPKEIAAAKSVGGKKKVGKDVTDDLAGFAPGSYWTPLEPEAEVVEEPENTINNPRAPTNMGDATVPVKHNFAERFDRPVFAGRKSVPKMHGNGKRQTGEMGQPLFNKTIREKILVKRDFLRKHHLSSASHPVEFADAFIPWHENPYNAKYFSMDQATTYTNLKAQLGNAGAGGTNYKDFKPFSCKDIRQYLGLYIINGLSPSPRMEMKFKPQAVDPVQGNDYIVNHLGANAERRWRHFKCFFALQDPRKDVPNQKVQPLFKVHRIVNWINFIGKMSVSLGMHLSVDEQTIGFQGRHGDKMRITFKAVGDGFQCDVICDSGFTYCVYFRNVPAPAKYLQRGMSALHARVLWLFDHLEDHYHRVWMDNLYLSASFARACYLHEKKVCIAGVTRKGGRGLPVHVLQDEKQTVKEAEKVRGTVKVAVLNGDPLCPYLVASSVYDTKPVHFLSMICESISWIKKERSVFNVDTNKMETMNFLRLNINDSYNNDMGHVDVSDQLREVYKFNSWLRNYKWWWSIFQWALGVLLVNSYVVYKKTCEADGITPITHYEFRKAIALSWIDKNEPTIPERRRERTRQSEHTPNTPHNNIIQRKRLSMSTSERPPKRMRSTPPSAGSGSSTTKAITKAPHLNDNSISNPSGPFARRLDRMYNHYPEFATDARPYCALHRYVGKLEERRHVYRCTHCKINLCIDCFREFHTRENIKEKKANLAMMMQSRKKLRAENKPAKKT